MKFFSTRDHFRIVTASQAIAHHKAAEANKAFAHFRW